MKPENFRKIRLKKWFNVFVRTVWFFPILLLFNNCDQSANISSNLTSDFISTNSSIKSDSETAWNENHFSAGSGSSGSGTGNGSGYDGKLTFGTYVPAHTDSFQCEGYTMPKQILNVSQNLKTITLILNEPNKCGSKILNIDKNSIQVLNEYSIGYDNQVFQKITAPNFPLKSVLLGRCYLSARNFLNDIFQFKIIYDLNNFKYVFYLQDANGKPVGNLDIDSYQSNDDQYLYYSFPYLLQINKNQCQSRPSAILNQTYLDCSAKMEFEQNSEIKKDTFAFCSFWMNDEKSNYIDTK